MSRIIGIRHRVKRTADGEARPTMVAIATGNAITNHKLESDQDELDFILGHFPTAWGLAGKEHSQHPEHHRRWRKLRASEDPQQLTNLHTVRQREGKADIWEILEVPTAYDGLQPGDRVYMCLGGSGDRLASAISRRSKKLNGNTGMFRIPPALLDLERATRVKDNDHALLAELGAQKPQIFTSMSPRDRQLVYLTECWRAREDAMKARIACEQRLRQQFIGRVFCTPEGEFPEGNIELQFDQAKANDPILQSLEKEEAKRNRDLANALETLPVWEHLLSKIEGVGPAIAARLIVAIGDIRRFPTDAKLKAFLGVHVLSGGKHADTPPEKSFPRARHGQVRNWKSEGRQALYLLADQCNRRPKSTWGAYLLKMKQGFRERHPEVVEVNGVKRYTDGHIHKMALWRTVTRFVEWLHREWSRLEKAAATYTTA